MKEMRSSREVILPKMSFRLGAAAGNEEERFLFVHLRRKCVHFRPAWASGAGGAGSDCRFKGFRLGTTTGNEEKRFLSVNL